MTAFSQGHWKSWSHFYYGAARRKQTCKLTLLFLVVHVFQFTQQQAVQFMYKPNNLVNSLCRNDNFLSNQGGQLIRFLKRMHFSSAHTCFNWLENNAQVQVLYREVEKKSDFESKVIKISVWCINQRARLTYVWPDLQRCSKYILIYVRNPSI